MVVATAAPATDRAVLDADEGLGMQVPPGGTTDLPGVVDLGHPFGPPQRLIRAMPSVPAPGGGRPAWPTVWKSYTQEPAR